MLVTKIYMNPKGCRIAKTYSKRKARYSNFLTLCIKTKQF